VKDHLHELADLASDGLDRLFQHCDGWPGLGGRDRSARYIVLAEFVGRHCVEANTFYSGTVNRSVGQIRREAHLREAIEAYLDAQEGTPGFSDGRPPVFAAPAHLDLQRSRFRLGAYAARPVSSVLLPARVPTIQGVRC